MASKEMHLRAVGNRRESKEARKVHFDVIREEGEFSDQQIPDEQENKQPLKNNPRLKTERLKFKAQFLINEDPRKSRFSHSKLMAIQKISCLLTTLIFFLSLSKTQMDILTSDPYKSTSKYIMYTLSVCIISLIFMVTLRYVCLYQLQHDQNKVYLKKSRTQWWLTTFFMKSDRVKFLLLQIILILPHPLAGLQNKTFQLFQTYDQIYLNHSYNDLLSLALLIKVYIIVRSLVSITTYSSPRASRLCYQNGFQHNLLYIVKCILHAQPLTAIMINFGILLMIFGYALKLSEGVLFLYNPGLQTGFQGYQNCFYCIFITMSTVGYGDYYPKTLPGRLIILVTAICGVLLSSLLIVSLSLYLQMIPSESKSHITLLRLGQQKKLMNEAAKAFTETIKIHNLMGKTQGYKQQDMKNQFLKLKYDIDSVKARSRKIKSIVDTDNIVEEMNRLFYILKDNLKDIFIGQLKLREEISKIEEIQSIKLSFIKQVSEMLSKASGSRPNTANLSNQ